MVMTFSEFLRKKAETYGTETEDHRAVIAEWKAAVVELFGQLRAWLAASDPDQIVQIEDRPLDVNEPNLGRYRVSRLDIRAFGKWIGVIPKARKTIKTAAPPRPGVPDRATGRVDMTDEVRRYVLYRFDGDAWFIEDPAGELQPLTQSAFEAALMSYFQ